MDTAHLTDKRHKGNQAELLAQHFLEQRGFELVTRNFLCKTGEIDLIMQDSETLVFVEVRYRRETDLGSPLETITGAKQRKLTRTAQFFLQQHFGNRWPPCRFDAVGIIGELETSPTIEWVANAF